MSDKERAACKVPGCDRPWRVKGYCQMHYERWKRYGDPLVTKRLSVGERFFSRIDKIPSGCWVWTGSIMQCGYGRMKVDNKTVLAHRLAYELMVGPIPEGLEIDHLCRNRACVNPEHLEPVTGQVNTLRGETIAASNAAKTHCPKGHPYNESNTFLRSSGRGCRECGREAGRLWYARKKMSA